ncbi:MAG: TIGR02266 family protein [Desulfobacterales bacterium]|nr:MAG: TIGR02266 family protein [Desulfobacterales bacterium]UCG81290.1 MAG: TIGR02266 family protein [Desulfobacterales bacterium]
MFYIASEEAYQDGQIIVQEGGSGDWVYVILSGTVQLSKMIGGKKYVVEWLQPGEIFGEVGFFGDITRTATAQAIGETTVGLVDRGFLDSECNKLPSDFRNVLISMIQRYKKMINRVCEFSAREGIRLIETLSVTYKDKRSFVKAYTGNVSGGGLFIKTEQPLKKGEDFLAKLELPGLSDPVVIKCEVIWTRKREEETDVYPAGMGVKFIEMTKENNKILRKYLRDIEKRISDE